MATPLTRRCWEQVAWMDPEKEHLGLLNEESLHTTSSPRDLYKFLPPPPPCCPYLKPTLGSRPGAQTEYTELRTAQSLPVSFISDRKVLFQVLQEMVSAEGIYR